jgi:hypothetical protein
VDSAVDEELDSLFEEAAPEPSEAELEESPLPDDAEESSADFAEDFLADFEDLLSVT